LANFHKLLFIFTAQKKMFSASAGRKEVASNFLLLFVAHFRLSGGAFMALPIRLPST